MAKNDADDFGRQMDAAYTEQVEGVAMQVTQKVALDLLGRIVLKTPVDKGRARGSWDVTIGRPTTREPDRFDKSGDATIQEGTETITAMTDLNAIWIQSNLTYISALENGHSSQAPAGMVSVSIAEIETFFARVE